MLFEAVEDAVFLFEVEREGASPTFVFRWNNPAHENITGMTTDEYRGRTLDEIAEDEMQREQVAANYRRCVERRDTIEYEETLDHPAGTVDWHTKLTPIVEDGEVTKIVGVARDVGDQKERERELNRSRERLRALFDQAPDGIVIHDADGNVLDVNETIVESLGYTREELRSMTVSDFEVGIDETTLKERWGSMDAETMQKIEVEGIHRRKDGSTYPVDVWVSKISTDGDERYMAIARDVTERNERERQLERHQTYLENTSDIVTLIDPDGTITFVSAAVERVLGYDPDDLIGEDGFEYVHPEDRAEQRAAIQRLADDPDEDAVLEFRFRCADGGYCWIESTVRNLLEDPDVQGILLSSRDVTERKEHEQQVSALHGATRSFIDAESKQAVADRAVETASELLGFSLPSVWFPDEDESVLELVANSEDHQELLDRAGTPEPTHSRDSWVWEVFESGETTVRSPLPRRDLAADVPLRSTIVLPLGDHGVLACAARGDVEFDEREIRVTELLARNVQVTLDQLEQRAALERQQVFVDDLLDAIEDVVYVLDRQGDLQKWNVALEEVTGYGPEEIESMNAADFFAEEDAEAVERAVREAFETGRTRVELAFVTAAGESVPYEFIANVFTDPDGRQVMAGIGRDRTVHVEYETALEEQRDRLEVLNQVMRHDVRNDMQVISGRAGILEAYVEEEGIEHLRAVQRSAKQVVELTKTARELTKTMLRQEKKRHPVRLDRTLESELDATRAEYDEAVIRVDGIVPEVEVWADELLEAVFRNLLQNAVIHNDKDVPEVAISVEDREEVVRVQIADNGPGIHEAQKEQIFGKGEKSLDSPGTGLGLYLVKTLIESYDGDVWVEDNEPEGAVFVVELPRCHGEEF